MDGAALAKHITTLPGYAFCPAILMVSPLEKNIYGYDPNDKSMVETLAKPVKLHELDNLLTSLFTNQKKEIQPEADKPVIKRMKQSATILVAEDDPVNMLLISEVLGKMGVKVLTAGNGMEVIEMLQSQLPDMIFMDINMPEMDGFSATAEIRLLPAPARNIPIIALTADAMKEDRDRCIQAGMNDYISKPFRLEELENVLSKYLLSA